MNNNHTDEFTNPQYMVIQDSKQRSITEMFQRSFTEDDDDVDKAILLQAANDWE